LPRIARLAGVFDRHEVRVRAAGALAGQLKHSRAERSQHARPSGLARRRVGRGVHGVQVGAHRGQRRAVDVAAHALDRRPVAHTDPEQETPRERPAQRPLAGGHGHGVASVDAGDAGRDDDSSRCAEQQRRLAERLTSAGLREPERAVAERVEFGRCLGDGRPRLSFELEGPDANPPNFHARLHLAEVSRVQWR